MEEKKENGIETLISLAIKYDREKEGTSFDWNITNGDFENHIYQKYLISKEYGFIKWLVENEKIAYNIPNNSDLYKCFELACVPLDNTDYITMLLSIQDNPIEFLVSILK